MTPIYSHNQHQYTAWVIKVSSCVPAPQSILNKVHVVDLVGSEEYVDARAGDFEAAEEGCYHVEIGEVCAIVVGSNRGRVDSVCAPW